MADDGRERASNSLAAIVVTVRLLQAP